LLQQPKKGRGSQNHYSIDCLVCQKLLSKSPFPSLLLQKHFQRQRTFKKREPFVFSLFCFRTLFSYCLKCTLLILELTLRCSLNFLFSSWSKKSQSCLYSPSLSLCFYKCTHKLFQSLSVNSLT
jgi:hypothetical protein